ncbi:DUF2809 domain-containing protein [Xylanimonas ulmi]|uniref:D-alanyl-D-alanine carboxypeptidase-like protein n=1 Tax=Xylanimonas ulmi TaxID=228973 RepID=A0A4Q7LYA6_9MICO|nr:DUF2809 domain-containing protein [Xylanibacterium ulmi]RZS60175.1 D-alanyl-D-alanine carboxypeptidase-like protein [Xylanibacterium ulmi]
MRRTAPRERASRPTTAALAVVVVLAALASRAALPAAVAGPAGDALYATLVALLVALVWARVTPLRAGVTGFAVSAAVEALQLTGVPAAVVARLPIARYALGTTFVASDLAWYAVGALLGATLVAVARAVRRAAPVTIRHTGAVRPRPGRVLAGVLAVVVPLAAGGGALAWRVGAEADDLRPALVSARQALADAEGRVADDSTRTTLAAAIDDAEAVLAGTPLIDRRPGDAPRAGERVAADVAAVTASRLAQGRTVAATARDALGPMAERGATVLAATDGLGADPAVRATLASALDAAAAASAEASDDRLAAASDPADVERATGDLTAASHDVGDATIALLTAQDAVTCPEPDQVWFPEAGRLDDAQLAPIPWAPSFRLRADVLPGFEQLDAAFHARFGRHLAINSAYRTYADQVAVYNPANPNPLAAPPGCSNHGLGTAVDIDGISQPGSAEYAWLAANAGTYGWTHPDWAEPTGRLPEPWHWQSVLTPTTY